MLTLSNRNQVLIGAVLVLLLTATRGQHLAAVDGLPSASWAVFFLAGIYLRPLWVLPALLAWVWALDFTPHLLGGERLSDLISGGTVHCLTPAYFFLLPAYSALWGAGRGYTARHRFAWRTLLTLGGAALTGATVCALISRGGYYLFSGRFDPTVAEFATRLANSLPGSLQSLAFYIGMAVTLHALCALTRGGGTQPLAAAR